MWARSKHITGILPAHVEVKSFIGTAMAALYADAKLMKAAEAHPESLVGALMECASLGHRPGTEEYYLTPRGGKILGIEGYRGIVERMYRSGGVSAVIVREVCAKDQFTSTRSPGRAAAAPPAPRSSAPAATQTAGRWSASTPTPG